MLGASPGARLEVLAGSGHLTALEVPAAFDAVVRDFVAGLGPKG
jgi:pimeloyl-ACP methyl ester carboxylesterase